MNLRPVSGGRNAGIRPRLPAEIGAVDEKQHAPGAGVLDEPIDEGAGRVGLAGAGRHLDERARVIGGEGRFEVCDRFDLTFAQALGQQRRYCPQMPANVIDSASHCRHVSGR